MKEVLDKIVSHSPDTCAYGDEKEGEPRTVWTAIPLENMHQDGFSLFQEWFERAASGELTGRKIKVGFIIEDNSEGETA